MSTVYDMNDCKEVVVRKECKVTGVKCDICGKIIPAEAYYTLEKSKYFEVTTGHHDWGNDSHESIEHKDICPECIDAFVSKYLKYADGTDYIEIKTEYSHYHYESVI